jgi:hypothetical protein
MNPKFYVPCARSYMILYIQRDFGERRSAVAVLTSLTLYLCGTDKNSVKAICEVSCVTSDDTSKIFLTAVYLNLKRLRFT